METFEIKSLTLVDLLNHFNGFELNMNVKSIEKLHYQIIKHQHDTFKISCFEVLSALESLSLDIGECVVWHELLLNLNFEKLPKLNHLKIKTVRHALHAIQGFESNFQIGNFNIANRL